MPDLARIVREGAVKNLLRDGGVNPTAFGQGEDGIVMVPVPPFRDVAEKKSRVTAGLGLARLYGGKELAFVVDAAVSHHSVDTPPDEIGKSVPPPTEDPNASDVIVVFRAVDGELQEWMLLYSRDDDGTIQIEEWEEVDRPADSLGGWMTETIVHLSSLPDPNEDQIEVLQLIAGILGFEGVWKIEAE